MDWKLILQIVGVVLGLVYLWLEYRANIWLWVVGLVMPLVHGVLYYTSGLYADMTMNAYYILAGIYGWAVWHGFGKRGKSFGRRGQSGEAGREDDRRGQSGEAGREDDQRRHAKNNNALPISHTPGRLVVPLVAVGVAVFGMIAFVLIRFTDSTVPCLDAATTAMSVVAMWMLSRKYVEQWLVWLVVDLISCGLYIYKDIPFTAGLYGLYSVLAVAGYLRWLRRMKVGAA